MERAAAALPWLSQTLTYLVQSPSQRAAAEAAHLHRSTIRDRIALAESLLGWSIADPSGRFRLHIALTARLFIRGA